MASSPKALRLLTTVASLTSPRWWKFVDHCLHTVLILVAQNRSLQLVSGLAIVSLEPLLKESSIVGDLVALRTMSDGCWVQSLTSETKIRESDELGISHAAGHCVEIDESAIAYT